MWGLRCESRAPHRPKSRLAVLANYPDSCRRRLAAALLPAANPRADGSARGFETITHCPYKGQGRTWNVRIDADLHEDLAWSYPAPLPESQKIAGLIAFYNEKLDIDVDGIRHERPSTTFS
jgi:hypothetical protein